MMGIIYLWFLLLTLSCLTVHGTNSDESSEESTTTECISEKCGRNSLELNTSQTNKTCAKLGDWCQLHTQCCSNNCRTYAMKCGKPLSDKSTESSEVFSQGRAVCKVIGESCSRHSDCCSTNCLFFNYQCVRSADSVFPANAVVNRFGENNQQCKAVGERCETHDQCCTKNCLTFLRQCIQPAGLIIPASALGPISRPSVGGNNLDNRFGESTSQCIAVGDRCDSHDQCCSKNCLHFTKKCVHPAGLNVPTGSVMPLFVPQVIPMNPVNTRFGENQEQCQRVGERCTAHDECCSRNCLKFSQTCVYQAGLIQPSMFGQMPALISLPYLPTDPVGNRFGESDTACKEVGQKCFGHDECCSKNCLFFVHQCVQPATLGTAAAVPPTVSSNKVPTTTFTTVDVANRFEGAESPSVGSICKANGDTCLDNTECCSGNCLNFNRQCISNTHPVAPRDPAIYTITPPRSTVMPTIAQRPSRLECKVNGRNCNQDNECCSLTCDGNTNVCLTRAVAANQNFNQGNSIRPVAGTNNNNNNGGVNGMGNDIRKL